MEATYDRGYASLLVAYNTPPARSQQLPISKTRVDPILSNCILQHPVNQRSRPRDGTRSTEPNLEHQQGIQKHDETPRAMVNTTAQDWPIYLSQARSIRKQGFAKYMAENPCVSQTHYSFFRILLAWDKYDTRSIQPSNNPGKLPGE